MRLWYSLQLQNRLLPCWLTAPVSLFHAQLPLLSMDNRWCVLMSLSRWNTPPQLWLSGKTSSDMALSRGNSKTACNKNDCLIQLINSWTGFDPFASFMLLKNIFNLTASFWYVTYLNTMRLLYLLKCIYWSVRYLFIESFRESGHVI